MSDLHTKVLLGMGVALILLLFLWILKLLLPWLIVMGLIGGGVWLWRQWQTQRQIEQRTLNGVFYDLLRQHQGRISILDFAMTAEISPQDAKAYLDARAQELSALFEPTEHGDIIYAFYSLELAQIQNRLKVQPPSELPPKV
ncbi:MAG: hypothetical protein AAF215_16755 [Cyanobacteria bacterium P01_A01_bin.123]